MALPAGRKGVRSDLVNPDGSLNIDIPDPSSSEWQLHQEASVGTGSSTAVALNALPENAKEIFVVQYRSDYPEYNASGYFPVMALLSTNNSMVGWSSGTGSGNVVRTGFNYNASTRVITATSLYQYSDDVQSIIKVYYK